MRKKISIVISPYLSEEIAKHVSEKGRSRFVEQALRNEINRIKTEQLRVAYREAAKEAEQENLFFEGVSGDGISWT